VKLEKKENISLRKRYGSRLKKKEKLGSKDELKEQMRMS
jgi:hypothetical protein